LTAAALVVLFAVLCQAAEYSAPAGVRPAIRRPGAASILPGGRIIVPIGTQYITGPGPFALAASPSGRIVVAANRGPERFSVTILEREKNGHRLVRHLVASGETEEWRGVSTGAAFDGEHAVYISEGASGRIWIVNPADGSRKRPVELNQDGVSGSFTGDLAFDPERKLLYALDETNARLVAVDMNRRRIAGSLRLGGSPRALSLAPDRRRAYVILGGEACSLAIVNLENAAAPSLSATVPMGSVPSGVLATADRVFVSHSAQDSISVIDARTSQVIADIPLRVPGLESLRGLAPMGLALHEPTGWLLAAEAGANAIAVIDTKQMRLIGHLPVGWSPARVLTEGDTVYVTNSKGHGASPNTGRRPHDESFQTTLRRGSVTVFPIPSPNELAEMTGRVMAANGFTPKLMTEKVTVPSAIRHVVLIVKGNRTFDDVLGDLGDASNGPVMAAATLARFGRNGYADGRNIRLSLQRVDISPNHHQLAGMFSFADNFYADGQIPWARLEQHGVLFRAGEASSDQARASQFIGEIERRYGEGGQPLPPLVVVHLPNGSVAGPRPGAGFPYEASYVADNDYALGRIVEFLSHSRWWREMAVLITEQEAPDGFDHIDAQRSILLCAGPYCKKNYASHVNAGYPSLLKTLSRILRLPPVNLFDATASDLDFFTATPDFSPYNAVAPDKRVFDPAKLAGQATITESRN
jgi:YVTN family beta-propeller protein